MKQRMEGEGRSWITLSQHLLLLAGNMSPSVNTQLKSSIRVIDASVVSYQPQWKLLNQSNQNDLSSNWRYFQETWNGGGISESRPPASLELMQQTQEPRTLSYSAGSIWRSTLLLDTTVSHEGFWISSSVCILFLILPLYNFCTWQLLQYGCVWGLRHLVKFRMRLK